MKRYILGLVCMMCGLSLHAQILSLDSCKSYAISNNKQLKEARLKVEESEEVKKSTYTNFFPQVSADFAMMKANDYLLSMETSAMNLPVYNGDVTTLASATEYAYVPSLEINSLDYANVGVVTVTQPVYAGGQVRNGYKLASLGKEINEESLTVTTQDVIVTTEEYYWSIVSLVAKRKTLASYEKLLNSLLNDVQVAYDAGLIEKSDLLKVQLKINETNAKKLELENGIDLLKMALCQHIGISYSENISLSDTTFHLIAPAQLYSNPDEALERRSEYQMLNKAVDAQELKKKLTKGEMLPTVAVSIMGQYLDIADNADTYGIALASVSIPISDWWSGSHKLKEHNLQINQAEVNLDEKSELMKLQMQKAFSQLTESYKQIDVSQSVLEQSQEHLKVVKDNYDAGIMTTSDLLEAQAIYQEAQDGLTEAKTTYQIRQVYYLQAIASLE